MKNWYKKQPAQTRVAFFLLIGLIVILGVVWWQFGWKIALLALLVETWIDKYIEYWVHEMRSGR